MKTQYILVTLVLACAILMGVLLPTHANAATMSSCKSFVGTGGGGVIAVQIAPGGSLAWGISLYIKAEEPGIWTVDVKVGTKRVDRKAGVYPYAPHGALPPTKAKHHLTFSLGVSHKAEDGATYSGFMACRIP